MPKEYIEREALLKRLEELNNGDNWIVSQYNADWIYSFIDTAPAADVVEVVRCKDCKWYESGKNYTPYCNNVMNLFEEMKLDDFCSYGERRIK